MTAMARPAPRKVTNRPARGSRIDREGHEQMVLMRWLNGERRRGKAVGVLLEDVTYHVPNGGQRNKKTAADLKAQGVRAGVSDLVIASARGGWHGLYLEFKATPPHDAALAGSQREWLARMEERGYLAVLAKGVEEAKAVLIAYADWPATQVVGCPESMPHGSAWRRTAAE
ncbi:VRR-NUC domain-containing protein [Cobetia amphilecti]|uniref:VRR-NUC domain-containing protein n=1 Tax=Cobetia amphilecti TaxID=1055104 RepID=A0ABT6UTN2_9GAMM|nr:VRR-NUC domain-containing protein [Cobetia amphilecti]MDI5886077.1 VRR-NUC domain-containing protein [Cobetia amphilecti]